MTTAIPALTRAETTLMRRDPMALVFGLAFPALLLLVIGLVFPGSRDPSEDLGGARLVDLYAPISLVVALATMAFSALPTNLAAHRERGFLRRLSTTPVHPRQLVAVQLGVHVALAAAAAVLTVFSAALVLGVEPPANPLGFLLAFLLAASSLFGLGLLVGAVAGTASTGQNLGLLVYFPMLFFSGVYFPREVMSDALRTASDLTPAGAAVQALSDAWAGGAPSLASLGVMAAFTVVSVALASRLFRWG